MDINKNLTYTYLLLSTVVQIVVSLCPISLSAASLRFVPNPKTEICEVYALGYNSDEWQAVAKFPYSQLPLRSNIQKPAIKITRLASTFASKAVRGTHLPLAFSLSSGLDLMGARQDVYLAILKSIKTKEPTEISLQNRFYRGISSELRALGNPLFRMLHGLLDQKPKPKKRF